MPYFLTQNSPKITFRISLFTTLPVIQAMLIEGGVEFESDELDF